MCEFRVFLPILKASDSRWMTSLDYDVYDQALAAFLALIGPPSSAPEVRSDSYVVGASYFGLKFRHMSKLEIKTRVAAKGLDGHFVESWAKSVVGKKGATLDGCKPKVLSALTDAGFGVDEEKNSALLDRALSVTVNKKRKGFHVPEAEVTVEICYLTTSVDSAPTAAAAVSVTTDELQDGSISSPDADLCRSWISVCVEGDAGAISSFLRTSRDLSVTDTAPWRPLWELLQLASAIAGKDPAVASVESFVPVCAGYPSWTRILSNVASREEIDAFISNVRALNTVL